MNNAKDESNFKRLKASIRETGVLGAAIVWNERTGNIVSGHQRLKALDALEGKNDYEVRVTVINVDDKTEKKLNVRMNSQSLQGDFDLPELANLISENNFTPDDLGFDQLDFDLMFESDPRLTRLYTDSEEAKSQKEEIKEIKGFTKEDREEMREKRKDEKIGDLYVTVIFHDNDDMQAFYDAVSAPLMKSL